MNVRPEKPPAADLAARTAVVERWFLSLLVPGLGQFAQRRLFSGAGQLGTVLAYAATALALGSGRILLLAVAWNVWSAIDAYRHERP